MTGLGIHLYTTKQELDNAKKGVSTILAWPKGEQPENAIFHISVSVDICDVLDDEVRVNIFKATDESNKVVAAFGAELERVFKQFAE